MSASWKTLKNELADSMVLLGMCMLDSSDSSSEEDTSESSATPSVPLLDVANLSNLGLEDSNALFNEQEIFGDVDGMEIDGFPGFEPADLDLDFAPFEELEHSAIPMFDDDVPFLPRTGDDRRVEEDLDEETSDGEEELDQIMGCLFIAFAEEFLGMRGPYGQILKSQDWFELSMSWPPTWFRTTYRMSSRTFWRIATLLKENPIFQSKGKKPQRPVHIQLACFLYRFGRYGSASFDASATLSLGVGTVFLYCDRVTRALRRVGLECIAWPDEERKEEIKAALEELSGIPGAIGAGDGSLLGLTSKPREEGNSFVTYKGFLAVNIFCVVDHQKRFIAHEGGWPGCKCDKTTFRHSRVWQCRGDMIRPGEVLLVDKGFFSSPYTCRPYDKREISSGTREERKRKREFNARFSKARVIVEHAFGMLKMRFPGVSFMGTSHKIDTNHTLVEALLTVHNLCIDYNDEDAPDEYNVEDDDELPAILHRFPGHIDVQEQLREGGWDGEERAQWLLREGNRKREELCTISQQWAARRN